MEECRRQHVLVGKGGMEGHVVRIGPPLCATTAHVDELVAALDKGLAVAAAA